MITILAALFVIGVLVFVHESGHFLAARSIGVRVDRFSLGFPPRLLTFTPTDKGWVFNLFFFTRSDKGKIEWGPVWTKTTSRIPKKVTGTEYCIALIPLGGYVKTAGSIDESLDDNLTGAPDELTSQPRWKQAWVISAGVLMNFLLAIIIFSGLTYFNGIPEKTNEPVVLDVNPGLPASEAGIITGDRIESINGEKIETWGKLTEIIHARPLEPINVQWRRNSEFYSADIMTQKGMIFVNDEAKEVGLIGITGGYVISDASVIEAGVNGVKKTGFWLGMIVKSLKMVITGEASVKELGGPITIAKLAGESARAGMSALFSLMAIISINLAFINIMPIPGLDGGHLLIIVVEGIIRRALSIKTKMVIQQVGMVLLLLLIILVFYVDISRFFFN